MWFGSAQSPLATNTGRQEHPLCLCYCKRWASVGLSTDNKAMKTLSDFFKRCCFSQRGLINGLEMTTLSIKTPPAFFPLLSFQPWASSTALEVPRDGCFRHASGWGGCVTNCPWGDDGVSCPTSGQQLPVPPGLFIHAWTETWRLRKKQARDNW